MWIGQFASAARLSTPTVRFYVRKGLLRPKTGSAGGSRPYLEFSAADLRRVDAIRMGQAMGLSLAQIKVLIDERRSGSRSRMLETMTSQRTMLRQRAAEIASLARFVDQKIQWLSDGCKGPPPEPPVVAAAGRGRQRDSRRPQ